MKDLISAIEKYKTHVDIHYHIGLRVVKTALSVLICLALSLVTGSDNIMQISSVSALVTLRSTQKDTISSGVFRVFGTMIGGLFGMIAVLIGLFLPYYSQGFFIIVIPIMLVLDLYVCNLLKMQDSCSISCVVTLIVASQVNFDADVTKALFYTLFRIRDTLIGVVVATCINTLPYPFKTRVTGTSPDCSGEAVEADTPPDCPGEAQDMGGKSDSAH